MTEAPNISRPAKLAAIALVLVALAGLTELASVGVLVKLRGWSFLKPDGSTHVHPDPTVGWIYVPGHVEEDAYGPGNHIHITQRGFRGVKEVAVEKAPGRYRIVCVGDSFTFGAGVGDLDGWCPQLEQLDPRIEAVNMGVGAAGVDQSILFYERDGQPLEHDLVVMAFIEDDYVRMISDARRIINPKPRFLLRDGALELTNVPVPDYGQYHRDQGLWGRLRAFPKSTRTYQLFHDALDQLLVQRSYDRYAVATALFTRVRSEAEEKGRRAALVHLAVSQEIEAPCPTGFCERQDRAEVAVQAERAAAQAGLLFIDTTPRFHELYAGDLKPYFLPDAHYSKAGHRVVAEQVLATLRAEVPGFPQAPLPEPGEPPAEATP